MASPAESSTGVNSGIRIALSLLVGISCGIFILLWDGNFISHSSAPDWLGAFVIVPFIALVTSFSSNCLIQYLNCRRVNWSKQASSAAITPIPIILIFTLIHFLPGLRWPIEGLIQSATPEVQKGLSSGYYGFWAGMYIQSFMGGLSQIC